MLSTGELADRVGYGLTPRRVDRMIREELIPYIRFGAGWVQVPAWVATELISRAQEQLRLRSRLGALAGTETPEADTEREEIRRRLAELEGPIVDPAAANGGSS